MTELLEQAISRLKSLPAHEQDAIANVECNRGLPGGEIQLRHVLFDSDLLNVLAQPLE